MTFWRRPVYYNNRTHHETRAALEIAFSVDRDHPVDTAQAQGEDLVARLAHLVDMLHDKGVLSTDDLHVLMNGAFEIVE